MRRIFLTVLFLSAAVLSQAQYKAITPELYFGADGGATLSTITTVRAYTDKGFHQGVSGGLKLRYIAEKNFGLECGLRYTQSGWSDDYGYLATDSYERSMSFLEIPFLLHTYLEGGRSRYFLNAGPKLGYFLSESEEINSSLTAADVPYYHKATERRLQYGIMGSLGFEFHLGRTVAGLEGGYYYGLSDIFENAVTADFVTSDLQAIHLNLFLLFQVR